MKLPIAMGLKVQVRVLVPKPLKPVAGIPARLPALPAVMGSENVA